jgi:hypothetical protein
MSDAESFDRVFTLLAVVADARGCKARLSKLKKLEERTAAALAKLEADRAAYEAKVAETTADLKAREEKTADRLLKAMRLEKNPPSEPKEYYDPFPFDPNFGPGTRGPSGLARDDGRSA